MHTRTLIFVLATLATSCAMAADAPSAKVDTNACVFFSTVYDWKSLDNTHLVIWAPGAKKDPYLITTSMPLTQLRNANRLGFVDGNNDGRLCGFGMDKIIVPDSAFTEQSSIASMSKLDDAGLAALSEQYHVKLGNHDGRKDAAQ